MSGFECQTGSFLELINCIFIHLKLLWSKKATSRIYFLLIRTFTRCPNSSSSEITDALYYPLLKWGGDLNDVSSPIQWPHRRPLAHEVWITLVFPSDKNLNLRNCGLLPHLSKREIKTKVKRYPNCLLNNIYVKVHWHWTKLVSAESVFRSLLTLGLQMYFGHLSHNAKSIQ